MMYRYFAAVILFLVAHTGWAQEVLHGNVRDAAGDPLPGANVYLRGTNVGTTTDVSGVFQLEVPADYRNATLVISMIGYENYEVAIGTQTTFDVTLKEDLQTLSEVVITGYTSQERDAISGAVSSVSSQTLVKVPVPSIDQALQGRVPGVVVSQNTGAPGEGVSMRIRGVGSINSGNDPLYIVDGIPTLNITNFSPQDFENITVLKDASAAAIYGSRAANGVVIVTTKSGKGKQPKIEFNAQAGIQQPSRRIEMADTREYVSIFNEAATADNATKTNPLFFRDLITEDVAATLPDVNHVDEIMRNAVLQSHSLSISGQAEETEYFVSLNYFDQEGIVKGSDYNRLSARVNITTQVKPWLRAGVNLNLAKAATDLIGSSGDGAGGNGGSVIRYAFFRSPAIPVYDAEGNFTDKPERYDFFGDGYNPVGMLAYNRNERISNQVFGKVFVDLKLTERLSFVSNTGFDVNDENQKRFDRNWGTDNRINNPNQLSVWRRGFENVTFSNVLTYSYELGEHRFNALLGTEAIKRNQDVVFVNESDFDDQEDNLVYLGNAQGLPITSEGTSGSALLSFFGKIDYAFAGKYTASATLRRDGSSRFGADNRWGTFYAGSLGWRLDKEAFLLTNDFVDRLFLRAGYGKIGNQEIGDYPFVDQIRSGYNYVLNNAKTNGYAVAGLGNSNVRWESSNQFNGGVDVTVMGGKVDFSIDYFHKLTTDLLVTQPIASSAGQALAPWVNNGEVVNRGIEIEAAYNGVAGDFRYLVSANAASLHNEVREVTRPYPDGVIGSDKITLTETGYPIGSFYLYEMAGIFQDETQIFTHAFQGNSIRPGDVMYKDQDNDGDIDADDRAHVGSAIPKITAGLSVSLGYRNWDLSVFFQGAYGQKIFSVLNRDIEGFYRAFNVTQRYYDNHWTAPGTSNEYPRASWDASGNNTKYSTRFLEDGSYTRLKNLQLGYSIPGRMLERAGISSVRIYFSGTNLLTFTKYSGLDPEMTVSDNARSAADRAIGIDWGTYPSARSYNLGVNLTF